MKTNPKAVCVLTALVAQFAFMTAFAGDVVDNPGQFSSSDYKFAKEAAHGGLMEVKLGEIAQANSQNSGVKDFGKQMSGDHTKAGQDLQALASRKGATLPAQLTAHQQKEVDRLSKMTGPVFDKAYMAIMVKDHKTTVKAFQKASESADDADLKTFASTTLPTIQGHLKMAEDLDKSVHHELSSNQ